MLLGGWNDTTVYISSFIHFLNTDQKEEFKEGMMIFNVICSIFSQLWVAKKRSKKLWLRPAAAWLFLGDELIGFFAHPKSGISPD